MNPSETPSKPLKTEKWWHPTRIGDEFKKKWPYVYAVALGSAFSAGFMAHIKVLELTGRTTLSTTKLFCLKVQQDPAVPCGDAVRVHSGFVSKSLLTKADGDAQWRTKRAALLYAHPDFSSDTTAELQSNTLVLAVESLNDWVRVRTLAD